jgi:predicted membrane protein
VTINKLPKTIIKKLWFLIPALFIFIGICCLEAVYLKISLISIGIAIIALIIFSYTESSNSNNKILSGITGILFFIILLSVISAGSTFLCAMLESESRFSFFYAYNPTKIERDSAQITVKGKIVELKSSDIGIYNAKNIVICKEERYTSFHKRMKDIYTIRPIEKCKKEK